MRINSLYVQYLIIRLISICIILFIFLLFKSGPIFISTALILPLSIDKITFAEDLDKPFVLDSKIELTKLYLWNFLEVKEFLESLDDNNYFVLMYFLPTDGDIDVPQQYLSKPFLINKYSSETTITCFINERLNYMVDTFYLDKSIFYPDLLDHEYTRVPSILDGNTPSILSGAPPSYHPQSILSGPPPSYHLTDRYYIHDIFENSINLDFILWLILIFIFTKQIYNNFHYSLLFLKFNNFHYSFILLL